MSELTFDAQEIEVRETVVSEISKPFDLQNGPLIRINLFALNDSENVLFLLLHHIISDGWSMGILIRDLAVIYKQLTSNNKVNNLPALQIQYADYAKWQNDWLQKNKEPLLNYWLDELKDSSPVLELPTDFPRPPVSRYHGAVLTQKLSAETRQKIRDFGKKYEATDFMILLSVFYILLYRYTRQTEYQHRNSHFRTQPKRGRKSDRMFCKYTRA